MPAASGGPAESDYGTPVKDRVATLGFLNKRNNITQDIVLRSGEASASATPSCALPPASAPRLGRPGRNRRLRAAFREERATTEQKLTWHKVFSGWLFKNSPSLNVVEHPVYDVWVKDCAMKFPRRGRRSCRRAAAEEAAKPAGKVPAAPATIRPADDAPAEEDGGDTDSTTDNARPRPAGQGIRPGEFRSRPARWGVENWQSSSGPGRQRCHQPGWPRHFRGIAPTAEHARRRTRAKPTP
jgi:hypothetical protein